MSESKIADAKLVEQTLGGNREAFRQLVDKYMKLPISVAYGLTSDPEASRDIAQETFLDAHRQLSSLKNPEKFSSWIYGIARRKSIYWIRKERRTSERFTADTQEIGKYLADDKMSPLQELTHREQKKIILETLESLPEKFREVLVLRYLDDKSYIEISEAMGLTLANVDKRLSRAKAMLKEKLSRIIDKEDLPL